MAQVPDDLLGFPATPGVVDVLEGRLCAPNGVFSCAYHPLQCLAVNMWNLMNQSYHLECGTLRRTLLPIQQPFCCKIQPKIASHCGSTSTCLW